MVAEWCGRAVAGRVGARLRAQPGVAGAARERRQRAAARPRARPARRRPLAPRPRHVHQIEQWLTPVKAMPSLFRRLLS